LYDTDKEPGAEAAAVLPLMTVVKRTARGPQRDEQNFRVDRQDARSVIQEKARTSAATLKL
jgi:hypothetical protein